MMLLLYRKKTIGYAKKNVGNLATVHFGPLNCKDAFVPANVRFFSPLQGAWFLSRGIYPPVEPVRDNNLMPVEQTVGW